MIFNYLAKQFYDDGRDNVLEIQNFRAAWMKSPEIQMGAYAEGVNVPDITQQEAFTEQVEWPKFVFQDGILKAYSGQERLHDLARLYWIMTESEISLAQTRAYLGTTDPIKEKQVLDNDTKKALQTAIDNLAEKNGLKIPDKIGFFNDRFILYLYPLIRSMANNQTNYHKVIEDIRNNSSRSQTDKQYSLPLEILDSLDITAALKTYVDTGSKEIRKFVINRIVRKTDLVKSLSPDLLDILLKNSSKIFGIEANTQILTYYEDIMLEILPYIRYVMDIFSGNVDHVQKYLASKEEHDFQQTSSVNSKFLSENFSPVKINLILAEKTNHYLHDMAEQYNKYSTADSIPAKLRFEYPNGMEMPKNWKTVKELHDKISVMFNEIKAEDNNKTIPYTEKEWGLHGMKKDGVELMLPSEGRVLVEWGAAQAHCVASYADRAAEKQLVILGIKVYGKHLYTAELRISSREYPITPEPQVATGLLDGNVTEMPAVERRVEYSYEINQFQGYKNTSGDAAEYKRVRNIVVELLNENFEVQGPRRDRSGFDQGMVGDFVQAAEIAYGQARIEPELPPAIIQDVAVGED